MNPVLFAFWLGGIVAMLGNMAIEWKRSSEHVFFQLARSYPVRIAVVTAVCLVFWPATLAAVFAKSCEDASDEKEPP